MPSQKESRKKNSPYRWSNLSLLAPVQRYAYSCQKSCLCCGEVWSLELVLIHWPETIKTLMRFRLANFHSAKSFKKMSRQFPSRAHTSNIKIECKLCESEEVVISFLGFVCIDFLMACD